MPPPTANDPWLPARRFGIIIDAGSSGSRLQIYSWRDARVVKLEEGAKVYDSLLRVEKGTEDGVDWVTKVEPGISSFADNPEGVAAYLAPLLEHARSHVPPSLHAETPLLLSATAGMRLLSSSQQADILLAACDFIRFHSHFRLDEPSLQGPCGSSIRVITGEEEGLFGWIAVNYLMDGFVGSGTSPATYGFMDMGGASTQIAFEPSEEQRKQSGELTDVKLRLIGGKDIEHQVFVTTWLGYGTNQARERYVSRTISRHDISQSEQEEGDGSVLEGFVLDPCLPRGLKLEEPLLDSHDSALHTMYGTGSFEQCLKDVSPLLNKEAPCPDVPCPINGVHVPHIDFSVSHFIGVSEYWYSSEHVFGLGGIYDFVQFERAASEFCSRDWSDILSQHEQSKEAEEDDDDDPTGKAIVTGPWKDTVGIPRLQMQCFKAAWIVNVLHEGIGLPRIVDPSGNLSSNEGQLEHKASEKGLGKPIFQSMDMIGDTAISWTLGQMVLEASREIPPLFDDRLPQSDPLGNAPDSSDFADPFAVDLEDPTLHHLSPATMQFGRNFFPGLVLYSSAFMVLFFVLYRLRVRIIPCAHRTYQATFGKSDNGVINQMTLEDGRPVNGRRSIPTLSRIRFTFFPRILSLITVLVTRLRLSRFASYTRMRSFSSRPAQERPNFRNMAPSPARMPPYRSFSTPSLKYQNDPGNGHSIGPHAKISRLPSSTSNFVVSQTDQTQSSSHMNQSFYTLPRSRNNSQMNLTSLVPRQPLSRNGTNSGRQTPIDNFFHDND